MPLTFIFGAVVAAGLHGKVTERMQRSMKPDEVVTDLATRLLGAMPSLRGAAKGIAQHVCEQYETLFGEFPLHASRVVAVLDTPKGHTMLDLAYRYTTQQASIFRRLTYQERQKKRQDKGKPAHVLRTESRKAARRFGTALH